MERTKVKKSNFAQSRFTVQRQTYSRTDTASELKPKTLEQMEKSAKAGHNLANISISYAPSNNIQCVSHLKKGTKFSEATRKKILKANKAKNKGFYTCDYCKFSHGKKRYLYKTVKGKNRLAGDGSFHIDHIKPFSKGGKGIVKNGRVYCGTCNTSRGAGNKITMTGYGKFRGLDGKTKVKVLSEAEYNKRKKAWDKGDGSKPMV